MPKLAQTQPELDARSMDRDAGLPAEQTDLAHRGFGQRLRADSGDAPEPRSWAFPIELGT